MSEKKRIPYLDMAKGVGIVLMVAGHLFGSLQTIDYKPFFSPAYQFIASFHMPLFFILSGILFFMTGEEKKEGGRLVLGKARTLLLPYATFSLIYMVMNVYTYLVQPELIELSFLHKLLVYTLTFHGISVLWFLPTLFFGELLFFFFRKRLSDKALILCIFVQGLFMLLLSPVFSLAIWEENLFLLGIGSLLQVAARSVLSTVFLAAGYFAGRLFSGREKKTAAGFLLGAGLLIFTAWLCFKNVLVDLNYMVFGNIFLYMICACTGSFGVILVCRNFWEIKLLTFYGKNSLVIMATHMEFKIMLHAILFSYWLNQYITRAKEWVLFGTIAVYITFAEAVVIYLYHHFFYRLIGKRKPDGGKNRIIEKTGRNKK